MSGSSARKTCAPGRNGIVGSFTIPCASRNPMTRASPRRLSCSERLFARLQRPRGLEAEVALALQVVQLAEHFAVELVDHGEVVSPLHRARQTELELAQPDVPEDAADLFHDAFHPAPRI